MDGGACGVNRLPTRKGCSFSEGDSELYTVVFFFLLSKQQLETRVIWVRVRVGAKSRTSVSVGLGVGLGLKIDAFLTLSSSWYDLAAPVFLR